MSFQIKTGAAFDKRVAELAWEEADDFAKSTIINALALSMTGNRGLYSAVQKKLITQIFDSAVDVVLQTSSVKELIQQTVDSVSKSLSQKRDTIEKEAIALAARLAVDSIKDEIENLTIKESHIREHAMEVIRSVVADAASEVLRSCKTDMNAQFRASVAKHIEARRR